VRTTIRVDDDLYRQIKEKAARSGRPVAALIEDALRSSLLRGPSEAGEPVRPLPTYGSQGTLPGVDLADNAALLELMEENVPVDARR